MKRTAPTHSLKNLLISGLFFSLSSASYMAYANVVSQEDNANVVLYRAADNSSLNYRFSVDGKSIGKLKYGSKVYLQLAPGQHRINANDSKKTALIINVKNDHTSYIRSHIDRKSRLKIEQEL